MIVAALTAFQIAVCPFVWAPAWKRMYRRKSSSDYSLWTMLLILYLQLSNLTIAILMSNKVHTLWFALNAGAVLWTCGMVGWYRRKREGVGF